ncbi:MAG: MFS transporter [Pseudomonadota bacterium]|nr:MFS transporter [Pseudomonadota bacterium]
MREIRSYQVDEIIDSQPIGRLQVRTVALCCAVAALNGFDGQVIGFLAPAMAADLRVDVRSFGPMFAAGFLGLMIGAMVMGPLGDRIGRKPALLISTVVFGVLAAVTGFIHSVNELVLVRFLTGLGLGGALPNVAALATEYMPKRLNRIPASLIGAAIPAGAMGAGLIATLIVPQLGWRWMFYLGGLMPLILAAALALALPESARYLSLDSRKQGQVRRIMAKIWPDGVRLDAHFAAPVRTADAGGSVFELFREGRATVTSMLWVINVMSFMLLYFIVSWMPALLKAAALPLTAGIMSITAFSFGGIVGSLAEGPLMNRLSPERVLFAEFIAFAMLVGILAALPLSLGLVAVLSFALGVTVQAAQAGLIIFAVTVYPTEIRSTGAGWCVAVGIVGSIIGPLLGGAAMLAGWSTQSIFASGAVPALCAATAVAVIAWSKRELREFREGGAT